LNCVLNLNTPQTTGNFLNYIQHNFSGTITDWYSSLDEEGKNELRIMETLATVFKTLYEKIKIEFIDGKINSEEKARECQRNINDIEIWDIRYLKNYIAEFS